LENNFNFDKTFTHDNYYNNKESDVNNCETNRNDTDKRNDSKIKTHKNKMLKRQSSMNILAKATVVNKQVCKKVANNIDYNAELEKNKIN
jgi:hypothetical protein